MSAFARLRANSAQRLVVGCIDEDPLQAQAFTRERTLAVAERSFRLLITKYGLPHAAGDENYIIGGAVEAIESVRLIKEKIPYVNILGISNISFGLPAAAREVVNSVFLYYCTKAGLDLAIVNAEKLERFASIPEEERRLAEPLLFNTHPVNVAADHMNATVLGVPRQDHSLQDVSKKVPEDGGNNRANRRWQ